MVDPNTRQGKRTPVTLKIKFKSETLEQFIERYAVDVSSGGIFIRTKEPLAVGTQMKFEFQLRDASPLIAGEGTVVWTRENDPSRPAIAPGMGVRFDRLADGSQGILERILAEKAKQAPQRPNSETAKPPLFTDTPTRVAPAPMQDALLGKDNGRPRRPIDDPAHSDSHTPLPKPMPFHSDADEFPDEAFEEATKVRALDELIAQTAEANSQDETTQQRRNNGRNDATLTDPTPDREARDGRDVRPPLPPALEVPDVPDLPNPPELARPQPRLLDTSPSPRIEPLPPAIPESLGKTRLGVEPARARIGSSQPPIAMPPPPPPAAMPAMMPFGELPPLPSGMRAVAAEPTEPARMPPLPSRSIAPLLILIFVLVAAAGAAVWFFVLRPQAIEPGERPASGTTDTPGSAVAQPGSGAAPGSAQVVTPPSAGSAAGSNVAAAGSAAPPPGGTAPAKADLVDTVIASSVEGSTVEIPGTDQNGPAPFTAKLEKGKSYKARVSAHGYAISELEIHGGEAKQTAKLVAKPRVLTVNSDPPGAAISIDGTATGHNTPFDLDLTAAQGAKKSIRVGLRKQGFRPVDHPLELAKFTEEDTRMTFKLDEKLTTAPAVVNRPPPGTGSARPPGSGAGSDSGGDSGTETPPSGGSSQGSAEAPTPPAPAPTPAPAPAGGSSGSAEPEPEFNKKQ